MAMNPSDHEERWVREQEELLAKKRAAEETFEQRQAREEQEAAERKSHFMKCPKCGYDLVEIDHDQIKVDRCTNCNGVWLDAGELDHVLGRKSWDLLAFFKK